MIRVPPSGFSSQAPYPVALIQLNETRIVCQLVDWDPECLRVGQKVVLVIRRVIESPDDGVIPYGVKANQCKFVVRSLCEYAFTRFSHNRVDGITH